MSSLIASAGQETSCLERILGRQIRQTLCRKLPWENKLFSKFVAKEICGGQKGLVPSRGSELPLTLSGSPTNENFPQLALGILPVAGAVSSTPGRGASRGGCSVLLAEGVGCLHTGGRECLPHRCPPRMLDGCWSRVNKIWWVTTRPP